MILLPLLLSLWLSFATAVYITPANTKHLAVDEKYDYVIVGAGIGGLVVATRLSEDLSGREPDWHKTAMIGSD